MPEKPTKPKKTAKTVTLLDSTWALIDSLGEQEQRGQSAQIEYMVLKQAAPAKK